MLTPSIVRPFPLAIAFLLSAIVQLLGTPWALSEQRDEARRSPQIAGVKATSGTDDETSGNGLSRGLRISLAAGTGAFLVMVHISMYLTGHGLHRGH
jgi:hypothetical protein